MLETIPKIADLKLLRELSKVIIIPMLISAYLIESNFTIFDLSVNASAPFVLQTLQFILIFLLSTIIIGTIAWAIHKSLIYVYFFTSFNGLYILATLFLAFGFLGIYGDNLPVINDLGKMWFYTSFVCGFYFLARSADIDKILI